MANLLNHSDSGEVKAKSLKSPMYCLEECIAAVDYLLGSVQVTLDNGDTFCEDGWGFYVLREMVVSNLKAASQDLSADLERLRKNQREGDKLVPVPFAGVVQAR